jgi:hypothetical protein
MGGDGKGFEYTVRALDTKQNTDNFNVVRPKSSPFVRILVRVNLTQRCHC